MNIVLISNYQPDAQQSMRKYPEMLRRMLESRGHTVRVVHPPVLFGRLVKATNGYLSKWIGYFDKYVLAFATLRWQCRGADLVHVCDHSNAMYLQCAGRTPRVITCHDLLAVRAARGDYGAVVVSRTGRRQQSWILACLRKAPFVICVSRKTADDLTELAPELKDRCRVVYHSLNWAGAATARGSADEVLRRYRATPGSNYLLHVGGNAWYKNRLGVLRIFAELRKQPEFGATQLITAGDPWTDEMREYTHTAGLDGTAIEALQVPDEALRTLYTNALALLFPSLEEGFGWPILEAQACGCPVITTNRAPMTEVAGGAAILIPPEDPVGAAAEIISQWGRREELRRMGLKNAEAFSPQKVADAYDEAYKEALRVQGVIPHSGVRCIENSR